MKNFDEIQLSIKEYAYERGSFEFSVPVYYYHDSFLVKYVASSEIKTG